MGKLKIGIIGCGAIAREKHVDALLQFPDRCEIVALADAQPAAAHSLQRERLPGAAVCEGYEALLEDPAVDAVHICTPNHSHCKIAVEALEAGKHVMCEKPMAETYADACRMVKAAEKNQRKLSVSYQNRFRSDSQAIHAAVLAGDLGEIYYAKAHATRRKKVPTWGSFLSLKAQGGGPLIDIGTHSIDLALWFMDNYEFESVTAAAFRGLIDDPAGNLWGPWEPSRFEVEDSAFGFIRMKNGALLTVEAAWALNIPDAREACVTVCGTKGGAQQLPGDTPDSYQWRLVKAMHGRLVSVVPDGPDPPLWMGRKNGVGRAPLMEMDSWLEDLEGGRPHVVRAEQAAAVVRVIEAMYESARQGRTICLA
ncbi:Gfo/Idh/MocA family protein [Anaerotruncus colihominis]|uniref:Gfo/Idh/MocA family protein n=1 Tax=Anaerotruncus colihominis TaxID=169435 RepID=UPI00189B439C|nr:Gfo/Idh/MocA family oxidoreductase [Anaerotruncus colihominis]